jgi:hypothetical protein
LRFELAGRHGLRHFTQNWMTEPGHFEYRHKKFLNIGEPDGKESARRFNVRIIPAGERLSKLG